MDLRWPSQATARRVRGHESFQPGADRRPCADPRRYRAGSQRPAQQPHGLRRRLTRRIRRANLHQRPRATGRGAGAAVAMSAQRGYRFALPPANHVFLPGHRIMVQVQSSWFPLYDRNPQTFVPNIFWAKPGDYQKATQRIYHAPGEASSIELPVLTAN
jgi:predicted acyl esterase